MGLDRGIKNSLVGQISLLLRGKRDQPRLVKTYFTTYHPSFRGALLREL
jgi:hypothetical protein